MKRTMRFLFSLLMISAAEAQSGPTVSGIVTEKSSGKPLEGVSITTVGRLSNGDVTESTGKFVLRFSENVKTGSTVKIHAEKTGCKPFTQLVAINSEIVQPIALDCAKEKPKSDKVAIIAPSDQHETNDSVTASSSVATPGPQPSITVIQPPAAYGNLAERCDSMGDAIQAFLRSRTDIQPAPSDRDAYDQWYRLNDGLFQFHFSKDVRDLQKELSGLHVTDPPLNELLRRSQQYFDYRQQNVDVAIKAPEMCHLSLEDISQIASRFKYLATEIPGATKEQIPRPYDLTGSRRQVFLELLRQAQSEPRDVLRIGCISWSDAACVAAGKFLILFSEAGWKIDSNRVFRMEPQVPIDGAAMVNHVEPLTEEQRKLPPHLGTWQKMDGSQITIYRAFKKMGIPVSPSSDESMPIGTLGIYFGPEPK